jgi:hypothetical protein
MRAVPLLLMPPTSSEIFTTGLIIKNEYKQRNTYKKQEQHQSHQNPPPNLNFPLFPKSLGHDKPRIRSVCILE